MRLAMAGNPNSGKTTIYNALTGRNEKIANWAGVTVDMKEHPIKKVYSGKTDIIAVDLPGAYSMSPFTSEESVTRDYVVDEHPDVIVNTVDGSNLSRSLFFTTQLLELGIPTVVALNKKDINEKKHITIDVAALSKKLGCPVIETVATNAEGLKELVDAAVKSVGSKQSAPYVCKDVDLTDKEQVKEDDRKRFEFVKEIVSSVEVRKTFTKDHNFQDDVDAVLTNKWLGIPIFAVVMFALYYISQVAVGPIIADALSAVLESFQELVAGWVSGSSDFLQALLVDGIIGGVIAVVGFLPLVMVLYFLLALLEDCGYMARVAVILDPIFKKVGLTGKSVIPFVVGTGCAVPGIMACRTIRSERERRASAMLTPFMPCGAKLPVIALFAGAFFPGKAWVSPTMYLVGIVVIFFGALLVKRITGQNSKRSFFIIELPEYKVPSLKQAVLNMLDRGKAYIVKAGTIILLCNTAVQIMQAFNWNFTLAETADSSILASIARPIAYLLIPIVGVCSWQLAAAAVAGFIAKENVVGTLAVCFVGLQNLIDTEELEMMEGAGAEVAGVLAISKVAALAYLMFNLYSPPCFAAIGAMNSEMKSNKWLFGGIALQLAVGYTIGFTVYQVGTLITTGSVGAGFLPGLIAVLCMVGVVVVLIRRADKQAAEELTASV